MIGSWVVDHGALDHGIAVPGVAVHPVVPVVGIQLGGGHGGREEAEEDQPRKSMLKYQFYLRVCLAFSYQEMIR